MQRLGRKVIYLGHDKPAEMPMASGIPSKHRLEPHPTAGCAVHLLDRHRRNRGRPVSSLLNAS